MNFKKKKKKVLGGGMDKEERKIKRTACYSMAVCQFEWH